MEKYELLPLTPEALEEAYRNSRTREIDCRGCEVPKDDNLVDLRKDCDIGLCSKGG